MNLFSNFIRISDICVVREKGQNEGSYNLTYRCFFFLLLLCECELPFDSTARSRFVVVVRIRKKIPIKISCPEWVWIGLIRKLSWSVHFEFVAESVISLLSFLWERDVYKYENECELLGSLIVWTLQDNARSNNSSNVPNANEHKWNHHHYQQQPFEPKKQPFAMKRQKFVRKRTFSQGL